MDENKTEKASGYSGSITASLRQLASTGDLDGGEIKTEKTKDQNGQSDSDTSSDSEDEADESSTNENQSNEPTPRQIVSRAQAAVDANIYDYNAHVTLIDLCKTLDMTEKLRSAREIMSQTFPLTEQLWLDWTQHEISLGELSFQEVCELFERGTKDYLCPKLWVEYVKYVSTMKIAAQDENCLEIVRNIFEKALIAIGLHATASDAVFSIYRSVEENLPQSAELKKERIFQLYKRHLSVPTPNLEGNYKVFRENFGEVDEVETGYKRACHLWEKIKGLEEKLGSDPSVETYKDYLEVEVSIGDPSRVRCLFERAVQDNCLVGDLWCKYIQFVCFKLKDSALADSICRRAVRNVPWIPRIWEHYINVCERLGKSFEEIKSLFAEALISLYGEDTSELYLAFLTYIRRQLSAGLSDSLSKDALKHFRDTYHKAFDSLASFPESLYVVKKFVAYVEAKFFKNLAVFRKIYDNLVIEDSCDTKRWVDYIELEEKFGTPAHVHKLHQRAFMYPRMTNPSELIGRFILYERLNGSLESLEAALFKTQTFASQVERAKEVDKAKEEKRNAKQQSRNDVQGMSRSCGFKKQSENANRVNHEPKNYDSKASKRHNIPEAEEQSDGFKVPEVPPTKKLKLTDKPAENPFKKKTISSVKKAEEFRTNSAVNENAPVDSMESEQNEEIPNVDEDMKESSTKMGNSFISNDENAHLSVFLSNLSFKVIEDDIRSFFLSCGKITGLSLAKNAAGKSKGFGNVIFQSESSVLEAMNLNREMLCGRPVFVSRFKPSKNNSSDKQNDGDMLSTTDSPDSKLVYSTGLEKHKLFISGLSTSTTREKLTEIFSKFGDLKGVRIVTYKNGHSKGLAFVEFKDVECASKALVGLDGSTVDSKEIKIAISNPPPRKKTGSSRTDEELSSKSNKSASNGHKASSVISNGSTKDSSETSTKDVGGKGLRQLLPRNVSRPKVRVSEGISRKTTKESVESNSSTNKNSALDATPDSKVTKADKERLIESYEKGENYLGLAKLLGVKQNTARTIIRRHRLNLHPKSHGGHRKPNITDFFAQKLLDFLSENCSSTIKDMQCFLGTEGLHTSLSTISNFLDGKLISLQSTRVVTSERNSESVKDLRQTFASWYLGVGKFKKVIYVDEFRANLWMRRSYTRSSSTTRPDRVMNGQRGLSVSVCVAITREKALHHSIKDQKFSPDDFETFLTELNQQLLHTQEPGSYAVVLEESKIRHSSSLPCGIPLVYLPPHSPFLNPIESVFSVYKSIIEKDLDWINKFPSPADRKAKLHDSIRAAILNTEDFDSFYNHCNVFLTKCLLKEDIVDD